MKTAQLVLHQYDISPFSEKVRLVMGVKHLDWLGCDQPYHLPKDDLVALTGGYRRVPVLQIGAELFFDSGLIVEELERRAPTPPVLSRSGPGIGLGLAHWAEGSVLMLVASLLYGGDRDSTDEYRADRSVMLGRPFDVDAMAKAWSANAELLRWHLALLERQLADGRAFLTGCEFDIADATFYAFIHYIRFGKGRTAALLSAFPAVVAWGDRTRAIGHGTRTDISRADTIKIAQASEPPPLTVESSRLEHEPKPGDLVSLTYFDANTSPVTGVLELITPARLALRTEGLRVGTMRLHMPRTAARVLTANA